METNQIVGHKGAVQTIKELYDAWVAADHAWTAAIKATFPKCWPGDVRYVPDGRGEPGTPLRAAYDAWSVSANAFRDAGGFDRLFKRGPFYETPSAFKFDL